MGSGATALLALPYPIDTDAPNVPGDMQALAQQVEAMLSGAGTLAARPAAGHQGRLYTETAATAGLAGTTWRDDGAAWRTVGSRIEATAANDIAQVIQAFAGQTANLTEWRNSGGAAMSTVDSAGAGRFASLYDGGNRVYSSGNAPPYPVTSVASRTGAVVLTAADVAAGTFPGANSYSGLQTFLAGVLASPVSAGAVGAIVRAFVGQTAAIQEWQNSGAAPLASVGSDGSAIFPWAFLGGASGGSNAGGFGATLVVQPNGSANRSAAIIKALVGQVGNLTEWQSSAGAALSYFDSAGNLFAPNVTGAWVDYSASVGIHSYNNDATIGNGAIYARYRQIGKTIVCDVRITGGSTSTFGTAGGYITGLYPVAMVSNSNANNDYLVGARSTQGTNGWLPCMLHGVPTSVPYRHEVYTNQNGNGEAGAFNQLVYSFRFAYEAA